MNPSRYRHSSVLVVDPVSSGALYEPLLAGAGVPVLLLDTERARVAGLRSEATPGALNFEHDFEGNPEKLLRYCLDNAVGYVVAGAESGIGLCEFLREALPDCPANEPDRSTRRWCKDDMFAELASRGIPTLRTVSLPAGREIDAQDAADLLADGPVVVKPSIGAGSVGVVMVKAAAELPEAVHAITTRPGFFGDRPNALVQELFPLPQHEYVIDTFSYGGTHEILGVSRYDKRVSDDGSFVYERITWLALDEAPVSVICDYAKEVLDALGVRVGSGHMEVMYNAEFGARLIDFGARAHGAGHPLKTFQLTGTSHIHRECEFVAHRLAQRPLSTAGGSYALARRGAIIFFNLARSARYRATAGDIAKLPGMVSVSVNAVPGRTYPATRSLLDSLDLGLAFIEADNEHDLDERCQLARAEFDLAFES
ncbi:ATP-grasp domain-containing protein [Nocardia sp. NPDC049149]|uniref:ATP-grasp domain-containing protein n=1 Tax=Nocardia sp. NPDC049149 TaxID=3364315 RepID=UPI00371117B8